MTKLRDVVASFPAVRRLGFQKRSHTIPFVQQLEWTDCGAASLTMVMGYHGSTVRLAEVRESMGIGRDGVSAKAILDTAEKYGLIGRGIKVAVEQLHLLKPATILHWEFNHFVVFDRVVNDDAVRIVDPGTGTRDVPLAEFAKAFTGVAIELTPTPRFTKQKPERGKLKRYFDELLSEKGLFTRILTISLTIKLLGLIAPTIMGKIVDEVVPRGDHKLLWVCVTALIGQCVFSSIGGVVNTFLSWHLTLALETRMTLGFLDHMVSLPFSFFTKRSTGDLMMRVESNRVVREKVTSKTLKSIIDGVFVLLYGAIIFYQDATLGAIAFAVASLNGLVFWCVRPTVNRLQASSLDKKAKENSYMVQLLGGIETLKCAGAERLGLEKWSNLFIDECNVGMQQQRLGAYVEVLTGGLQMLGPLLLLVIGANAVMKNEMTLGTMMAMNSLGNALFTPLGALITAAFDLQTVKGHMERIDDVLQTPVEQDRDLAATPPRLRGHVSVNNVSFKYGEQAPLVVQDVSLEIAPGMSVAFVGPSGSGKSTLLNLIAGLHKPVTGDVMYDGRRLHDFDVRAVRQQIGMIPQHPYIFGGSVRENVALGSQGANLDRIVHASRVAAIHDDIASMPMGYDTVAADGGASLSGGQRQRLAIARAVLRNPTLMLLDEATSALDNSTEARVIAGLETLRCTRITVAHRLSTIRNCDLIVVMDKGRIVEQGRYNELAAAGGLFSRLVAASQNSGNQPELPYEAAFSDRNAGAGSGVRRAPNSPERT
jgi:ABC-type bacteriocin/lantibiotic exporter with double-glycine peptidase domain